jgi:tetratricopeptide (TPR) repeat protein
LHGIQSVIQIFSKAIVLYCAHHIYVGLYDYYQLGVTYFELKNYKKALENFEKQSNKIDFAENIYYKSKIAKISKKKYLDLKTLALKTYDEGKYMKDPYTHHFNKVYKIQIEEL